MLVNSQKLQNITVVLDIGVARAFQGGQVARGTRRVKMRIKMRKV